MARALLFTCHMVPEQSGWRRLTFDTIETLPETGGVFEIGNLVRNVVYIDCAEGNLRRRLTTLGTAPTTLPPSAGGYYVRFVSTAKEAEARDARLAAYREAHAGQVPVGNARRTSLARLNRAA